jgi:hypothetical protein
VIGLVARAWGIVGVLALLGQAMVRLAPRALDAVAGGLDGVQWAALLGWCAFMIHAEGIRGFHRRFSPRVVARAWTLGAHARPWQRVLAPAYCMSLVHASRRGMIVAWSVLFGVIGLIMVVSRMGQPWRGIIDAGVVLGLGVGAASIVWFTARAASGIAPPIDADLPRGDDTGAR